MSRIGKIARRTFLIGSAAIAGGVAFGVYKYNEDPENPLTSEGDKAVLNPFVFVDENGITLITPKAEMGQGVHTTWAALIAEELDVELSQINVLHGPPAVAYYNSALMGLALPFLDYEVGKFQDNLRGYVGEAGKLLGIQLTGGSTSMKDGFERMRLVGASTRETFKLAAANRWGLDRADLSTSAGMVSSSDGRTATYVELAAEAAALKPPKVDLRSPNEWRLLGQSQPRVDMLAKVTGTAEFGADIRVPGMKFATVRMNPKRSSMLRFDASETEKMAGVERIVDLGDGIAVIASNTWLAMQAADAIEITWQDANYVETTEGFFDQLAQGFDGEVNATPREEGDVEQGFAGTEVYAEYKMPFLAHSTMEPMNATALYTAEAMTIWSGSQAPLSARDSAAEAVGLAPESVDLIVPYLGGAFGRRGETDFSDLAARVAKAMPGVPIKTTWSREEDMRHDTYRPPAIARFKGVVTEGEAVMLDGQIISQSVLDLDGANRENVTGSFDQPYGIPNYRIRGYLAELGVPTGFWRSVGASINGFVFDSFIDEMAHAAGRDPLEFRLELVRREHAPSATVLETLKNMTNWTGQTPDGIGRGVAFTYSFGTPVAEAIEVQDTGNGIKIAKCWIAADPGFALDPSIVEAQLFGGAIYGLSAAIMGEITFADGEVEQYNFPDYDALRMHTAPEFDVRILENNKFIGGIGEPGTPPAAPALANALFDLTGIRARELPLIKTFDLIT
ncbi:MAG: molybdopterin-dependent oxidoreductase [Paracoccaceae bacterium]|jgi:isoquinoline 1-oxidoreductase subunit beta|nr:molybdopterin-dependent oxidoreductase [Paracoccaceae bacterium]MDG1737029.1 molybdopterin-dependent oxidoreductase [Paracoccaceae bacterium]MDG2258365.1 molybdopterin-dependent oxidoreductase [Paracoccaceae bacterium]